MTRDAPDRWMWQRVVLEAVRQAEVRALDDRSRLLVRLGRTAAAILAKAMSDPVAPYPTRVRAADAALARLLRVRELAPLEARVAALAEAAGIAEGAR